MPGELRPQRDANGDLIASSTAILPLDSFFDVQGGFSKGDVLRRVQVTAGDTRYESQWVVDEELPAKEPGFSEFRVKLEITSYYDQDFVAKATKP